MTSRAKRVLGFSVCALMMAVLTGCAVQGSSQPVSIYHPTLPAGMETFDAVRKDLASRLENRKLKFMFQLTND